MKISLIIPVYNGEATLRRCLDSVFAQTMPDFECLVINDGSTDGTLTLLSQYTDSRLRVETVTNDGVSAAKNHGLSLASGEWIAFLDCDDYLEPDALETLLSLADLSGADLCVGHISVEDTAGTLLPTAPQMPADSLLLSPAEAAAVVFRGSPFGGYLHGKLLRASLARSLRYADDVHIYEDMLYLLEALSHANKLAYQPKVVHHYVVAGGALAAPLNERKASSLPACELMLLLTQEQFPQATQQARTFAVRNALWFAQEYCDAPLSIRRESWALAARDEARATAQLPCNLGELPRVQRVFLRALRIGWPCFAAVYRFGYRPLKALLH